MRSFFRASTISALIIAGCLLSQMSLSGQEPKKAQGKRLASVDGIAITEAQVRKESADDLESLELKKLKEKASFARNEQEILENALERLVEEKLLAAEAAKQGISKEALIAKEIDGKVPEITSEEIGSFYERNQQRIKTAKEEALPLIEKYLRKQKTSSARQAFIQTLEKEHKVIRSLEPLRFDVSTAQRPAQGPASAPVLLVLFSDFQCPYCEEMSETLKEVVKNYEKKVRLVFRQFPLASIHKFAQKAAEASLCADAQGHFWEMHDLLFQDQNNLSEKDLKTKAAKLGLNTADFDKCLDGEQFTAQIREDLRAGAAAGADGTPALFINGRFLNGNRPYEDIAEVIDEELSRKK
jgi:protein-disulfide isomerase